MKWHEPRPATSVLLLTLATLACLGPFLNKPFHIDDPLFIWTAQQIQAHPLDFYGFKLNWDGTTAPMSMITQNPPLAAYYLAAVGSCFGWSEMALHVGCLVPALALILGTYMLARRLCAHPLLVALATLATPVFVMSATTVMCDMWMAAFWVWAVYFWMEGVDGKGRAFPVAAALVTACGLSKYFGVAVIPLLVIFWLGKKRRMGWPLLWLMLPVLALVAYQRWTAHLYGHGLLRNAVEYAHTYRVHPEVATKLITSLAFVGGCIFVGLMAVPLLLGKRGFVLILLCIIVLSLSLASFKTIGSYDLGQDVLGKWLVAGHLAVFGVGGAIILAFAVPQWRTPEGLLLLLWVAGTFFFVMVVNWTVAGRNILPMAPVAVLLIVQKMEGRPLNKRTDPFWLLLGPIAVSLVLALTLAWADFRLAMVGKLAAQSVARRFGSSMDRVMFEGHWGFQYYIQQFGAHPVEENDLEFRTGDIIVLPQNLSYPIPLPEKRMAVLGTLGGTLPHWVSLMGFFTGAGYYSDNWGPCPYVFWTATDGRLHHLAGEIIQGSCIFVGGVVLEGPMPTYEYVCLKCEHHFDKFQRMTDDSLTVCLKESCPRKPWGKGKVKRVVSAGAGIIFKGSGFYETDYRSENYKAGAKKESSSSTSSDTTKKDSKPAPAKESKPTSSESSSSSVKSD